MSGLYAAQHLERKKMSAVTYDMVRHHLVAMGLAEAALEAYRQQHGEMASTAQVIEVVRETRLNTLQEMERAALDPRPGVGFVDVYKESNGNG